MTLKEAIERYTSNAEYERIHGNLQGCLDFRQLAEWLKDYERLLEQEPTEWQKDHEILKAYSDGANEMLDKIRSEIKSLQNANPSYWHSGDMVDREEVLEIIDKYTEGVRDQE